MKRTSMFVCLLVSLALACGDGSRGPDRTVRRFFRALNEKDVNQMLSCVDPKQERLLRATFRLVEKATGIPLDDFFELVPGLNDAFRDQLAEDFHFSNIRIQSRNIAGDTARLLVSVKSSYRSGGVRTSRIEQLEFTLEQFEDAGWRIISVVPRPQSDTAPAPSREPR